MLLDTALYDRQGRPRILDPVSEEERIKTLYLDCSCQTTKSAGLPCSGMLGVARTTASVLSFRHYHQHWFSNNLNDFDEGNPVFRNNNSTLNVSAVVNNKKQTHPPARLDPEIPPPTKPAVINNQAEGVHIQVSINGNNSNQNNIQDVHLGSNVSDKKKSRRYKNKN